MMFGYPLNHVYQIETSTNNHSILHIKLALVLLKFKV